MLRILVGATQSFDDEQQKFVVEGGDELQLEHSLAALSKWEAIHEKPFLGPDKKTPEELLSYIKCMTLGEIPRGDIFEKLSKENFEEINAYLDKKMTATWFSEAPGAPKTSELVTSELVYYWMTAFQIPFECENWNLNRLFTLIRVCNLKQGKPKKMSRTQVAQRNRELNARRKAEMGTKG